MLDLDGVSDFFSVRPARFALIFRQLLVQELARTRRLNQHSGLARPHRFLFRACSLLLFNLFFSRLLVQDLLLRGMSRGLAALATIQMTLAVMFGRYVYLTAKSDWIQKVLIHEQLLLERSQMHRVSFFVWQQCSCL